MLKIISYIITGITFTYLSYFILMAVGVFKKKKKNNVDTQKKNHFAIVIAARNEENVIEGLVNSLKKQNYDKKYYDTYVIVNNCTDNTEKVAKEAGAKIVNCTVKVKSKGDVLKFTFDKFKDNRDIDAYVIFDADNLVHPDFLSKMNEMINSGYTVAQGFRDTKNISDSWLSSSYAIMYYIQNLFINKSRYNLGKSAFLNGTGFMIKKEVIDRYGFDVKTVTEDIELTAMCAINGEKIGFNDEAICFDEQVSDFKTSLKQRKRWSFGTMECLKGYFSQLIKTGFKKRRLECFDIVLFYLAVILHVVSSIAPIVTIINAIINFKYLSSYTIIFSIIIATLSYLFGVGLRMALIKKYNKRIKDNIGGILLFDLFLLSWAPVNLVCLFMKSCNWDSIKHNRNIENV